VQPQFPQQCDLQQPLLTALWGEYYYKQQVTLQVLRTSNVFQSGSSLFLYQSSFIGFS
jgi:hypothetical protein